MFTIAQYRMASEQAADLHGHHSAPQPLLQAFLIYLFVFQVEKNIAPVSKGRQRKIRFFQSDKRLVRTWPRQDFELHLTCAKAFSQSCIYQEDSDCCL